jgi:hypothetical protein
VNCHCVGRGDGGAKCSELSSVLHPSACTLALYKIIQKSAMYVLLPVLYLRTYIRSL